MDRVYSYTMEIPLSTIQSFEPLGVPTLTPKDNQVEVLEFSFFEVHVIYHPKAEQVNGIYEVSKVEG